MIVLVGKTCSGKNSIKKELINLGMKNIVTYTTRPPRNGEVNGVDYHFIDIDTFRSMYNNESFGETAIYTVADNSVYHYGSRLDSYIKNGIIILNPSGLRQLKENHPGIKFLSFYIKASDQVIAQRLQDRGDDPSESKRRMNADKIDFKDIEFDVDFYLVNNGGYTPKELARAIYRVVKENEESN